MVFPLIRTFVLVLLFLGILLSKLACIFRTAPRESLVWKKKMFVAPVRQPVTSLGWKEQRCSAGSSQSWLCERWDESEAWSLQHLLSSGCKLQTSLWCVKGKARWSLIWWLFDITKWNGFRREEQTIWLDPVRMKLSF